MTSKPTNPYILGLKLFGIQLVMALVSVLFMGSFSRFLGSNTGMKIYSSFTAFFYLSSYYSAVWQAGRKDIKHAKVQHNINGSKINGRSSTWIISSIIAAIPNMVFLIILYINGAQGKLNIFYRLLQSCFLGWLGDDYLTYLPNCLIVTLIPFVLSFIGYLAGTKEFVFLEKYLPMLIYKKKDDKKKK